MAFSQLLLSAGVTLVLWALFKVGARTIRAFRSPFLNIPGPGSSNLFYGNLGDFIRTVYVAFAIYLIIDCHFHAKANCLMP